jgi:hypothetical protein
LTDAEIINLTNFNSAIDNSPSRYWFVHNWESESFFPTQAEAIAQANSDLTYCQDPDDGSWADFIEDIYVGYVTHQAKPSADGYSLRSTLDNDRTIATVLAALRLFQSTSSESTDAAFFNYFEDYSQLSSEEIDELCKELNCGMNTF